MNERIRMLRKQSREAIPELSIERAELLTNFYKKKPTQNQSIPITRALAFKFILENKCSC